MTTARKIVESALRKIHKLGSGQSLNADEAQDALDTLNVMMSSYSVDRIIVPYISKEQFNLTTASSYTIGPSGDFNTTRPYEIVSAYVSDGSIDYGLQQYDSTQFSGIIQKNISGIPEVFYYEKRDPLGTIFLYYTPSGVSSITINSRKYLTTFASLDALYDLPPEYESMLIYNLAMWIAPEYEMEASATVKGIANRTLKAIQKQAGRNFYNVSRVCAPSPENGKNSNFNIYKGPFN